MRRNQPACELYFMSALIIASVGCASGFKMRVSDIHVVPARTVLLPTTMRAYGLDYGNHHLDKEEKTAALERAVGAEFERQATSKGAFLLPLDRVRACGNECMSLLSTAIRWGERATVEIARVQAGVVHSERSSVAYFGRPSTLTSC